MKKILSLLLAICLSIGSFGMVSVAEEQTVAETLTLEDDIYAVILNGHKLTVPFTVTQLHAAGFKELIDMSNIEYFSSVYHDFVFVDDYGNYLYTSLYDEIGADDFGDMLVVSIASRDTDTHKGTRLLSVYGNIGYGSTIDTVSRIYDSYDFNRIYGCCTKQGKNDVDNRVCVGFTCGVLSDLEVSVWGDYDGWLQEVYYRGGCDKSQARYADFLAARQYQ